MDSVLRGASVYLFLLILFRLIGKRSLAQITTFDFVLLLIISEATQQAMLGDDMSVTNGCLVILSLVGIDLGLSLLKRAWPRLDLVLEDTPLVLIDRGRVLHQRLAKSRIQESEILSRARQTRGLERMEQIKYAVLEQDGSISIIPNEVGARSFSEAGSSKPG